MRGGEQQEVNNQSVGGRTRYGRVQTTSLPFKGEV
jgi:hypothetical protein